MPHAAWNCTTPRLNCCASGRSRQDSIVVRKFSLLASGGRHNILTAPRGKHNCVVAGRGKLHSVLIGRGTLDMSGDSSGCGSGSCGVMEEWSWQWRWGIFIKVAITQTQGRCMSRLEPILVKESWILNCVGTLPRRINNDGRTQSPSQG
jgi:hypothetical protein